MACMGMLFCTGCVDQSQGQKSLAESEKKTNSTTQPRVIATSMATVDICDKLGIDLVGVPDSDLYDLPERYQDLPTIGTAMAVDMEKVAQIQTDWILSPVSLMSDLKPKYEAQGYQYAFLNLSSVEGMYRSIRQLGQIFGKEEAAEKMVAEFTSYYDSYATKHADQKGCKVLILMGLPGSYVVATEKSYVGSLVKMAGGQNVYAGETADFVNITPEAMLKKKPDIILRTAHALPDQVMEMFADEFKTNSVWKHFDAVKKDKVYDLSYQKFGMSANFEYQDAVEELEKYLYE